ncbi:hypothetical protein RDI58_019548 [Solanum bulbocastanum]|uniref:Uncharacterized protein n=1 Tax=Solanum bulbocastanum TaxID=147425 RepID=A0AAN8Y733_SOLBU
MNLRSNLRGNTNDLDKNETACSFSFPSTFSGLTDENRHFQISHVDDNLIDSSYSPSFVSPTTPESNYFSVSSSCQMNGFGMFITCTIQNQTSPIYSQPTLPQQVL